MHACTCIWELIHVTLVHELLISFQYHMTGNATTSERSSEIFLVALLQSEYLADHRHGTPHTEYYTV